MKYSVYFIEIKNRFFLVLFSWFLTFFNCYFYKEKLLLSIVNLSKYDVEMLSYFIFTDVTEIFSVYLSLIFFISNQIFIISVAYHILMFFLPGLYYSEYKQVLKVTKLFLFLWSFSILFVNFILVPFSWEFFLSFQKFSNNKNFSLFFDAKISEYINFYVNLYYLFFFNCVLLLGFLFLINLFSKNLDSIKSFRRIVYCIFVFFSTLFSPPDVFSQIIISVSLILIYELFVFFIFVNYKLISKPVKTS